MSNNGSEARRNRTRRTRDGAWRETFIEHLREAGAVRYACEAAGISRDTAYRHRHEDEEFARAWDDALEDACDELEVEARRRAKDGSDRLLMFLLRAYRQHLYAPERGRREEAAPELSRTEVHRGELAGLSGEALDRELAVLGIRFEPSAAGNRASDHVRGAAPTGTSVG